MSDVRIGALAGYIRRMTGAVESPSSDRQLLRRFAVARDQAAFAALVQRHGGLVSGVCRRILGNSPDVEDVFQATFLVLARKAASIRNPDVLASWLYGVALRLARKVRAQEARRAGLPPRETPLPNSDPAAESAAHELRAVLDEELNRLPGAYRLPFVLCYLEGKPRGEVARQLGCSEGAVKGKLERGRELLRGRLTRRGLTLSATTLALALEIEHGAAAPVPAVCYETTATAGVEFVAGKLSAGASSALAEELLNSMWVGRWQLMGAVVLALGSVVAAATFAHGFLAADSRPTTGEPVAAADAGPRPPESGDPMPPAAVARLGTERWRHAGFGPLAFSPDGKNLISLGGGRLVVWDVAAGKKLRSIPLPPTEFAGSFQISPDGAVLATATLQGAIRLWDAASGKALRECGTVGQRVESLAFSADGKVLIACSSHNRGVISFWDAVTGAQLKELANQDQVTRKDRYALSPDGKTIVSWHDGDSSVPTIWDIDAAGATVSRRQVRGRMKHGGPLSCAAFSPDGSVLVAAGSEAVESQIRVWDGATGKEVRRLPGYGGGTLGLIVSPDGKRLVSFGFSRRPTVTEVAECVAQVYDLESGKEVCRPRLPDGPFFGSPMRSLTFSPDGKTLAARHDAAILFWDAATGERLHADSEPAASVARTAFSPDGRLLATISTTGAPPIGERVIRLWDAHTGKELRRLEGHTSPPSQLGFSPDGKTLVSGGNDRTVRLWDVETGKELQRIAADPIVLAFAAFGSNGKTLIYQSCAKPIHIWDVVERRELRQVNREGFFNGAACAPDGNTLLLFPAKGSPVLHNLETGKEVALEGFREVQDSALAFAPDGRTLAGLDRSRRTVYLWDARTGQRGRSLAVACRAMSGSSLAFAPDGRTLAVGDSEDDSVHLCDPVTGRERGRFTGQQGGVRSLAYSADGKRLASGGGDSSTLIWDAAAPQPPAFRNIVRTPVELEKLWTALASPADSMAYPALWDLVDSLGQALPLFRERLAPAPGVDEKKVVQWVADLDSSDLEVRQNAAVELEKLGAGAEQSLRKAVEAKPALEFRRRLEGLLAKVQEGRWLRERELRAVEALEHVGGGETRRLLESLTQGRPDAPLTKAAKTALDRLAE